MLDTFLEAEVPSQKMLAFISFTDASKLSSVE